ncbi:MAG: DUF456 domain-containing protein [Anaerolineae bacterium]|nr:DUF456 domain-containing protein [Anaerolineae bacterium]
MNGFETTMGIAESGLAILASILMVGALLISVLPFVPGPLLLWGISIGFGLLTNFQQLTVLSAVIITLLMIAGTTKDIWLPLLGMRTQGASCSSAFGVIVGGMVGTFTIPIPVIGTLIGAIVGAILMELLRLGDVQKAIQAGGFAFRTFVLGMLTELGFNLMIVATFFVSLLAGR